MKIRVKEILSHLTDYEKEEVETKFRLDLYKELCRVHGRYVNVKWALKNIFNKEVLV